MMGPGRIWRRLSDWSAFRYLVTGGVLFVIDLSIFLGLKRLETPTPIAQAISRTTGALIGFAGHKLYSFRNREWKGSRLAAQGTGYTVLTVANIFISPAVVMGFEWLLPGRLVLVKVLAEVVMVTETYLVLSWLFRARRGAGEIDE
ncbi:MAG: GtrA family protein [Polyangia bacterium]